MGECKRCGEHEAALFVACVNEIQDTAEKDTRRSEMGVIHFGDLEDLVAELETGQVVRVEVLDITEGSNRKYGIRLAGIGVHVRAFNGNGHILACYLPVKRLQMVGMRPVNDQEYEGAWEKAETEADRVRNYLTGCGFDVRPGVIEIGDVCPPAGGWNGDEEARA